MLQGWENMDITVLNAAENAVLQYGREHSEFIKNVYQHFSEKLGYKSPNYLYMLFSKRNGAKMGYDDLMLILEKTANFQLAEAIKKDVDMKLSSMK